MERSVNNNHAGTPHGAPRRERGPRAQVEFVFRLFVGTVTVLLAMQLALDFKLIHAERALYAAALDHLDSVEFGQQLINRTNEVAAAATLYVSTGDARYRQRFAAASASGEAAALPARWREAGLTVEQRGWLEEALHRAGILRTIAGDAIAAYDAGNVDYAEMLVTSEPFLREKAEIMAAIARFTDDLSSRRRARIDANRPAIVAVLNVRMAATLFAVAASALMLWYAGRYIVRPLVALGAHARRLATGDYAARNTLRGRDELGVLGTTLNFAAGRIGSELAERQRIAERLSLATRAARIGVWEWDLARGTIVGNDTWYETFGVAPDGSGAVEETWRRVHPDDAARTREAIDRALRGERGYEAEFRVVLPDGAVRHLRASGHVVRDAAGAPVRILGTNMDVTVQKELERARREAQEAAEAANRAKSTFLATVSHEIRTPMNGLLGLLELLDLTTLTADQRRTLAVIRDSGLSLQRVIGDILDFSKIEAGRLELQPVATSLADLVERVRNMYAGNASSKGLVLRSRVDPRLAPALRADPMRLRQVLGNLISNAIKFTPAGGRVEIGAELVEALDNAQRVRLSVSDTGAGIAPEHHARLFQPFARAVRDSDGPTGGTGLGLAICRRLTELMGGTIGMNSEVGRGTTMIVTLALPLADPGELARDDNAAQTPSAAALGARPAPAIEQAEAEGTLVLVADDHATNRMVLLRQLNTLGYAAEAVGDGAQALARWRTGRYGLLLADCHMPEMDGYELSRTIRRLEKEHGRKRTPIVACTANAMREDAAACFAAGADDYLAKPVTLAQMREKLDRWLPLPRARSRQSA